MELLAAAFFVGLGVASLWQAARDPRIDRAFWLGSLRVILGYGFFVAAGLGLLVLLGLGGDGWHQAALWAYLLGWFGLAWLWLIRLLPRLRALPLRAGWHWGPLDWILLALAAGGATMAWLTRGPL